MKEGYRRFLGLDDGSSSDDDDALAGPLPARRMHLLHGKSGSCASELHPSFGQRRASTTTREGTWIASPERPRRAKQLSESQRERIAQVSDMTVAPSVTPPAAPSVTPPVAPPVPLSVTRPPA